MFHSVKSKLSLQMCATVCVNEGCCERVWSDCVQDLSGSNANKGVVFLKHALYSLVFLLFYCFICHFYLNIFALFEW